MNIYKYLKGKYQEDEAGLFLVVPSDRAKGSERELEHRKFRLNIRNNLFTSRVTGLEQTANEVVEFSSLEIMKIHMNAFLCNLF